jgi:hypothetical protein
VSFDFSAWQPHKAGLIGSKTEKATTKTFLPVDTDDRGSSKSRPFSWRSLEKESEGYTATSGFEQTE